jgi:hypothetical protein
MGSTVMIGGFKFSKRSGRRQDSEPRRDPHLSPLTHQEVCVHSYRTLNGVSARRAMPVLYDHAISKPDRTNRAYHNPPPYPPTDIYLFYTIVYIHTYTYIHMHIYESVFVYSDVYISIYPSLYIYLYVHNE